MPSAARTALSASSSCRVGIPNTAMTASPMNFSTVPPWSSISARIASKYRAMTFRRDSGSSCSPSWVDPVTSQKRIVTVFRTSSAGEAAGSAEPQFEQNFASAALAAPQLEHAVIARYFLPRSVPNTVRNVRRPSAVVNRSFASPIPMSFA